MQYGRFYMHRCEHSCGQESVFEGSQTQSEASGTHCHIHQTAHTDVRVKHTVLHIQMPP
jgi:hypothetical protein